MFFEWQTKQNKTKQNKTKKQTRITLYDNKKKNLCIIYTIPWLGQ